MKKTEKILGIIAASLFVLGVFFKFMHWPGSGILHGLAVLLFNLGYLPLQLIREFRKELSPLERAYLIFRFIACFMVLLGFMFKIQHWPGSGLLLIFGTYLIPSFILFYFYMRIRGKGRIPFEWNDLILAVLAYVIHIYVSWSGVSPDVVNGYVNLEEQYSKLNTGLKTSNQLIYSSLDSIGESTNTELLESIRTLREISAEIYHMIDTLRSGFISSFYTSPIGADFDLSTAGLSLLASRNEGDYYFMLNRRGEAFKSALGTYTKEIEGIQKKFRLPANLIASGLDLEDRATPYGNTLSWEEHMFASAPIASILATLSWIEQIVLLTERGTQNQLSIQLGEEEIYHMLEELATSESRLAIDLKENEILRISQQRELQRIQLEKSQSDLRQRNTITAAALGGIVFVLVLLSISTRAYFLKQKDNRDLALQKDEISKKNRELHLRNEEIMAQRDEIEAQRDEIEAQRNMVFRQKEQIEQTHHEISASMDYAMRLQDTILPSQALLEENFSGHLIFYRPKQKVSGDFYWWTRTGSRLVIAVADCTGHGVPGAFMSLLGASLLKEIVNREGIVEPGKILDRMREEVIAALCQKGATGEQKDGMDMALISIDPETRSCRYAGANSPLYLVRRSRLTVYRPSLMPISHYEEMLPFETVDVQLEAGDQLYMFSDGYVDQFGGEERKKFKYRAFRQVLTEHADLSMSRQQQVLSDTIREWQGGHEQTDDMVIIGIRI